jgi:lipopolysaccharide transport system permease protein
MTFGITVLSPRYRELVLFKAYAGLRGEAARNYLNFFWWVLDPILSMSVYYVVFGVLIQHSTPDFIPFLLIGLVTWQWFANSLSHCMNAILGSGLIMHQTNLPKVIFPSIEIIIDVVKFAFVFSLLLIFLWCYGFAPNIHYIALPLVLGAQFFLNVAFANLVAAIIPFVPDLRFLIDAVLQLVFFVSGVLFAGASIPEKFRGFFYLNPMASLIQAYRDILMYGQWPKWSALGWVALFGLCGIYITQALIHKFDQYYPRIVK